MTHRHKKLEIATAEIEFRAESPAPQAPADPTHEEIAKLAYSYYVARGYQPGNPAEDWLRAVSELRARLNS